MAQTLIDFPTAPGPTPGIMMPLRIPRADPQVEALRQMFPSIEADVLGLMLDHHNGELEATVATLLDLDDGDSTEGTNDDAAIARTLQAQFDEAVAKAVHRSLQAELKAEDANKRGHWTSLRTAVPTIVATTTPTTKETKEKESASSRARKFLARVARPGSSASSSKLPRETAARLLEAGEASNSSSGGVDAMAPLVIPPSYAPPTVTMALEGPPSLSSRRSSTSESHQMDQHDPFRTISRESSVEETNAHDPDSNNAEAEDADTSASRYSARMSRARAANTAKRVQVQPLLAPASRV